MIDVALSYTNDGADLTLKHGQPTLSGGLQAAVYLSLFTPETWQDLTRDNADRYGSRIPEIKARGVSNQTRLQLIDAARNALSWLLDEGIAQDVTVTAAIESKSQMSLTVEITQPDNVLRLAYGLNWEATTAELREVTS